jgi:hypothetical protein
VREAGAGSEAGRSGRVIIKPAQAGAGRSSRGAHSKAGNGSSHNICTMPIGGTQRVSIKLGEANRMQVRRVLLGNCIGVCALVDW